MDVTLQQLRVIVAVHEAGGFTAAAESLRVAQPSLSRTVAEVERRLGAGLLGRDDPGQQERVRVATLPSLAIRHHVDHALVAADVRPRRVVAARNVAAVAGLVAAGLGVSAVPGLVVPLTGFADLVAVPLDAPVVVRRMALVRGEGVSPAAAAFADLLVGADDRPALPRFARWLP
ncbi:LysR family transcriptional regulator [Actinomycetospora lemnae]|uniref:LysR family transcriptional regulator n=1 Tax=Actinomycetospora lemnae TaxID=3019891 RepID=A0ABT5T4M0_9PSEU|nr:LysR family transcriptional regulator [Actinomycetospora sp. DW7H6]MDD7969316.1 LysR family transcriptional regulator [Actinomycetospora sp. DW7H6]